VNTVRSTEPRPGEPQTWDADAGRTGAAGAVAPTAGPQLCVVIPTFNECNNVELLVDRLAQALRGIDWEVVFVDDDSPDGTADLVRRLGQGNRRVRCLRRIGRRGLSTASIEGLLSTSASFVAVMDGDLQHDEALLPHMLAVLEDGALDLAIASRYAGAGGAGGLSAKRRRLSRAGAALARWLTKVEIADPVSGYFMLRREVVDLVAPLLSGVGTKILIDILASSPRPLSVVELPYEFRARHAGESKLDALTALEYVLLLAEKFAGRYFSHRLLLFGLVGTSGVAVNLAVLRLLLVLGAGPTGAAAAATLTAMVSNFFLNNLLTYRDSRLVGWRALRGLLSFMAVCGAGALVNVAIFRDIYATTGLWLPAGIAGAVVGALINYSLSSVFTWGRRL
jgi:dolichol-phosphate mannosyltransferase